MDRQRFLQLAAMAGLGTVASPGELFAQYWFLAPVKVANPLLDYPNRDWERIYRDIYRTDRTFTFLCAPNDTHNCLLRGFVKNNVMVRIEPTYGYGKATDLSGNCASARWDPRCCQKGPRPPALRRLPGEGRLVIVIRPGTDPAFALGLAQVIMSEKPIRRSRAGMLPLRPSKSRSLGRAGS